MPVAGSAVGWLSPPAVRHAGLRSGQEHDLAESGSPFELFERVRDAVERVGRCDGKFDGSGGKQVCQFAEHGRYLRVGQGCRPGHFYAEFGRGGREDDGLDPGDLYAQVSGERSHPIRGQAPTPTLTPVPVATRTDVVDTSKGTVHMVLGGGGTSAPSNGLFFHPPQCRVITGVGDPNPTTGKRPPIYLTENAPWSAVRDAAAPYGFAAFTVDPGTHPGATTSLTVTYYEVLGAEGKLHPFETFTLQRPRSDTPTHR